MSAPSEPSLPPFGRTSASANTATPLPEQTTPPPGWPAIAGYEILGVLGSGGMGIVYKARQVSLNRTVALKTLVLGGQGRSELVARFRREAEAVARLHHEHVVQIYDFGDQNGLPYFTMELVEGIDLAEKLQGQPVPARSAARLVEQLARAVQAVHEQGVLHRDLKPRNVLLQAPPGTPLGACKPKITDFGLAKFLNEQGTQTASCEPLGTPSYMAPEQVQGWAASRLGVTVDVYGLGAILYECLTGRPPFLGETLLETHRQVLSDEPVRPSRLQAGVPRDLETICLKCLQKKPDQRYPSAGALADDLRRFLAGEPIAARPVGHVERAVQWCRRHPLGLVGSAAVVVVMGLTVSMGFVLRHDQRRLQVDRVGKQIDAELDAWSGSPEQFAKLEALLTDFNRLAPEKAADYDRKVNKSLDAYVAKSLEKPGRLLPEDFVQVDETLRWLAPRAPALAASRREQRDRRYRDWQTLVDLKPPFTGWEKVINTAYVLQPDPRALAARPNQARAHNPPPIKTTVWGEGDVELEAEFDPSWESAARLGLYLVAEREGTELPVTYQFRLTVPGDPPGTDFGACRRAGNPFRLQILRDDKCQREAPRAVPAGNLHLSAGRVGGRLAVQVGGTDAIAFWDFLPPGQTKWRCALLWPGGVRLAGLRVREARPPAGVTPEQGDAAYGRGDYRQALEHYFEQARAAANDPGGRQARREALCKAAFCRMQLHKPEDAARLWERVALQEANPGEPWPLVASYQLWLVLARQRQFTKAADLFRVIAARYPNVEETAAVIPEDVRAQIVRAHFDAPDTTLPDKRLCVEICDLLQAQERVAARVVLLEAHWQAGDEPRAFQTASEALRLAEALPQSPRRWVAKARTDYCWLLRRRGEAARALKEVGQWLGTATGAEDRPPLLLERSRIHAALRQWDQAEEDLRQFFAQTPAKEMPYALCCRACLLDGFLRERRGDHTGARQAWRRGLFQNWARGKDDEARQADFARLDERIHNSVLASLLAEPGHADVRALLDKLPDLALPPWAVLADNEERLAAAWHALWRTPRGREKARQYALRELSLAGHDRVPRDIAVAALLQQQALPGTLSADEEAVLWEAAEKAVLAATSGQLGRLQLGQLALALQGTRDGFGWEGVRASLDPSLRSPFAYLLGRRYLHVLKKPLSEALPFFQNALDDAPPGSPLRRLAQVELSRAASR
jgi:Protein kinase domain